MDNPKPATWNDIRQGVRVRCIYDSDIVQREGQTATVMLIDPLKLSGKINVAWDDSSSAYTRWTCPDSFEVIEG